MCTIDLKNAYYLCPMHDTHKKCLRFQFKSVLYEYNCLSFGFSTAPFHFTKLLKPVIGYIRENGIRLVVYLDDLICLGSTYNECISNVENLKIHFIMFRFY